MASFTPDPQGLKFGPLWFRPGLSGTNIVTVNFAAFFTISAITFMGFAQPYLLNEMLQVPIAEQGRLTGNLAAIQEVIVILLMGFFGAWSDRIGRRPVYVAGLVLLGLGYFIYPLARTEEELMLYRAFFAIGSAGAPIMMSIAIHDSCQEVSRGKWVATNSICTGIGVMVMALVLAKLPERLTNQGFDSITAGTYAFWTTAGICMFAALVVFVGMRGWVKPTYEQPPLFKQVGDGLRAGWENPRLGVAYAAAFIGRGDLVVISTFMSLWVVQVGTEQGLSSGQGMARAGILFVVVQGAALLWSPVVGFLSDKLNRMASMAVALGLAALGYTGVGLIDDPLGGSMYFAAVLLGIGEISVLISSGAAMGEEAPVEKRGAIVGVFGLVGAVGILFAVWAGGIVFDLIGRTAPFVMMGILNAGLMLVALVFARKASRVQGSEQQDSA